MNKRHLLENLVIANFAAKGSPVTLGNCGGKIGKQADACANNMTTPITNWANNVATTTNLREGAGLEEEGGLQIAE